MDSDSVQWRFRINDPERIAHAFPNGELRTPSLCNEAIRTKEMYAIWKKDYPKCDSCLAYLELLDATLKGNIDGIE